MKSKEENSMAIPTPEKEQESWGIGEVAVETKQVIVKGEVVLTEHQALVLLLNKVEKICKGLGIKDE